MRIGVCQTPEILGDVDAAVEVIRRFAAQAAAGEVDLLVFPECFLQGYLVTGDHVHRHAFEIGSAEFAAVLTRLDGLQPVLVLGLIERCGRSFYNTAAVIKGGRVLGRYRKTFLTSGESVFTPGGDYPVFEVAGVRFGINICYDTQFPEAAAAVAMGSARVLLVPAQNTMRRATAVWWQDRHNEIRRGGLRRTVSGWPLLTSPARVATSGSVWGQVAFSAQPAM